MFQWYKSSEVCYTYLNDVSDNIESNLERCRWVARGWTLQELLAPREVVFYSRDWQYLGTRSKLSAHIARITGIDEAYLTGKSLSKACIAHRMSWAAKRTTTRKEDMAYCLLGIFDVNMSLIYGEGQKAFRRLQEVLIREYPEDHSLFAWGTIVKRLPSQIDDSSQIWENNPIRYEPDKANEKFFGLLAESPHDFKNSGRIVLSEAALFYFDYMYHAATVSTLSANIATVDLPITTRGTDCVFHLKRPQITQVYLIRYMILLCGEWNRSHTKFRYVAIPIFGGSELVSRTSKIVVSNSFTEVTISASQLIDWKKKTCVRPNPPNPIKYGSVLERKVSSEYSYVTGTFPYVNQHHISQHYDIPSSVSGTLYYKSLDIAQTVRLTIYIGRSNALNHAHSNSAEARECGRLRLGLHPWIITPSKVDSGGIPPLTVSTAPHVKERFIPQAFEDESDGRSHGYERWQDIKYVHDVVIPKDEWKISIIGVADIIVGMERIFFDDSDDDEIDFGDSSVDREAPTDDEQHRFVDVVDIIVRKNTEQDGPADEDKDNETKHRESGDRSNTDSEESSWETESESQAD
ncbi:hypothetical protein F4777DRAFT_540997 [Nemania sp. FL0916]|nr:hypothetical protein F4777DRAFT_540997 [Nemania sp. FL0916]